MNDMCMIDIIGQLDLAVFPTGAHSSFKVFSQEMLTLFCKTPVKTIMLRKCLFLHNRSLLKSSCVSGNKGVYQLHIIAKNDKFSFDISTCKLWCAILFYMRGDCSSSLNIVNQVLSSIPPYVMLNARNKGKKQLYVDIFLDSGTTLIQRIRKAWMFDLLFKKDMIDSVPLPMGIQIELYFSDSSMYVYLSPFTCAYYLQFLCYHKMCQYDRRDRALLHLIEVTDNPEQRGMPFTSFNIAGHCLLLAGKRDQARDMFYHSYIMSLMFPPFDKYNSALWYHQNYC